MSFVFQINQLDIFYSLISFYSNFTEMWFMNILLLLFPVNMKFISFIGI